MHQPLNQLCTSKYKVTHSTYAPCFIIDVQQQFDLVLGDTWLHKVKATFDYSSKTCSVQRKGHMYTHLIPTTTQVTGEQATRLYGDHVVKLHGTPKAIVSDHDPRLTDIHDNALEDPRH